MGQLSNEIKGLAQRGAQKAQKQNGNGGMDQAAMAKVKATLIGAKVKAKVTENKAAQKAKLDGERLVRDERRKDATAFSQIQRDNTAAKAKNRLKLGGD
jgi:hypothetical protein